MGCCRTWIVSPLSKSVEYLDTVSTVRNRPIVATRPEDVSRCAFIAYLSTYLRHLPLDYYLLIFNPHFAVKR